MSTTKPFTDHRRSMQYEANTPMSDSADEIDLGKLFRVIWRHKLVLISFSALVTVLTAMVMSSKTPIYSASASLLLEAEQNRVLQLDDVYGEATSAQEYYYSQLEIIRSRKVAEKVVATLNLTEHPFFNQPNETQPSLRQTLVNLLNPPEPAPPLSAEEKAEQKKQSVINYVWGSMSATPISKTQVVNVGFESQSPQLAALLANAIAQAYLDNHMDVNLERIEKSALWLNSSMAGLKQKLEHAEEQLAVFEERESLVDVRGIKSLAAKELEELSGQLLRAQQEVDQSELLSSLVAGNSDKGALAFEDLNAIPEVLNHPAVQKLQQQTLAIETKKQELASVYGPKHPKMIAVNAELAKAQFNVEQQVNRLIKSLGTDTRQAKQRVQQLTAAIAAAKTRFQRLTRVENQHRELLQEVETNRNLYEAFFSRLKETAQLEGFETSVGRIIDPATVPYAPSKPRKSLVVVLALMLSLMLGVACVLLIEALNATIRSADDVEQKLAKTLLGIIPLINPESNNASSPGRLKTLFRQEQRSSAHTLPANYYLLDQDRGFSEAVRTIRTSIQMLGIDSPTQVIAVTSTLPGEGKTQLSSNLFYALGQLQKTLIIDADMRRPSIAKNFAISSNQPGLSNYIAGTHPLDDCIVVDKHSQMDVLVAGDLAPNPQELLSSPRFKTLIESLKDNYERIIVDTPPILAVSDAILIAGLSDALVYVIKADDTKEQQVKAAFKRLQTSGINVSGIVLNQVDLQKAKSYDAFEGYYDQYGYST
ncbi:GumC family protein [Thalassotalea mangrovi]|uniref:GumC family protein n=1 Tax=Thalassotalea mangrovi TaxID=2572245 RepID=UPI00145F41E6|nr:polysaccharide biosynthesis tyrosine autokinase [Thalassotalea mangrovi]